MFDRHSNSAALTWARLLGSILAAAPMWLPLPSAAATSDSPQTVVPRGLPPEAHSDTPGGAAQQGVIQAPATADPGINKGTPPPGKFPTPVIPPPGAQGGDQHVIPK